MAVCQIRGIWGRELLTPYIIAASQTTTKSKWLTATSIYLAYASVCFLGWAQLGWSDWSSLFHVSLLPGTIKLPHGCSSHRDGRNARDQGQLCKCFTSFWSCHASKCSIGLSKSHGQSGLEKACDYPLVNLLNIG